MSEAAKQALDAYLLYNDVRETTADYYRRVVSTYSSWSSLDRARDQFTAAVASQFLRDKQLGGARPYYLKTLRGGLRTLLNFIGEKERLRSVRIEPLLIETWGLDDVCRLTAAVRVAILRFDDSLAALYRRHFWSTAIPGAWHTGLSQGDLFRLHESHVDPKTGRVVINRSRTGKRVVTSMPLELFERVRGSGLLFEPQTGAEHFRAEFSRIVTAAGLAGTFKKLRKSSGTFAERLEPGRGHQHLGNTRKVFETHYLGTDAISVEPVRLPSPG